MIKKRAPIEIKPSKVGSLTKWAKEKGFSTKTGLSEKAIAEGLKSKSSAIRKKANFANNAKKWNH